MITSILCYVPPSVEPLGSTTPVFKPGSTTLSFHTRLTIVLTSALCYKTFWSPHSQWSLQQTRPVDPNVSYLAIYRAPLAVWTVQRHFQHVHVSPWGKKVTLMREREDVREMSYVIVARNTWRPFRVKEPVTKMARHWAKAVLTRVTKDLNVQ